MKTRIGLMAACAMTALSNSWAAEITCISESIEDPPGTRAQLCMLPPDDYDPIVGWWGADYIPPKLKAVTFEVTVNGQSIPMPISSYRDLANARLLELTLLDDRLEITIRGGDAGTSYTAQIFVRDGLVRNRVVRSNQFSNDSYESTEYKYVEYEN